MPARRRTTRSSTQLTRCLLPPRNPAAQKTVIRTPFVCAAHPLPEKYAPMPLGAAKLVAGLVHSGPVGALRLLLRQK